MNINAVQTFGANSLKQNETQPAPQPQVPASPQTQTSAPQAIQKTMSALEAHGRAQVSFRGDTVFGPDGEDEASSYSDNLKILMKADNMSVKGARVAGVILDVFEDDDLDTILHSDKFKEGFDKLKKLSGKEFMSMSPNGVYETLTGEERESSKDIDTMPLHIYQQVVNK